MKASMPEFNCSATLQSIPVLFTVAEYLTHTLQHQTLVQRETVSSRDTDISRQVAVNL